MYTIERPTPPGRLSECKLVEFTSTSNGKKRPKRKPRKVCLLKYGGCSYQVENDRIKPNEKHISPDILAQEILEGYIEAGDIAADRLISEVRKYCK